MSILCDLSEFFTRPLRTGIQRVCFEIVSRWQGEFSLIPVCLNNRQQFIRLPDRSFELMKAFFRCEDRNDLKQIQEQIKTLVHDRSAKKITSLSPYQAIFSPEVFFCLDRIKTYQELADENAIPLFLVVYDFLPWIEPSLFQPDMPLGTYPYFRLLRSIPNLSYISDWSRRVAQERVFRERRSAGVTIPLGADGLGTAPAVFAASQKAMTVVGTIEPRKGHLKILNAFWRLWSDGQEIPLNFVGRPGWLSDQELAQIKALENGQPLFAWHDNLTDPQVAEVVKQSRATIYVSEHEGFGLPPVESLALGTPVIATSSIPSIAMIPPAGQFRLDQPNPAAIQSAVLQLMDDRVARRLTEEIRSLNLLTWDDSSKAYSDWIEERLASAPKFAIAS